MSTKTLERRVSLFQRPTTVRDILKGKNIIEINDFEDLVPAAEERGENEGILLKYIPIIPEGYYSAQNFSKRGPFVNLNTFDGNGRLLRENEQGSLKARREANDKYSREDGPFIGWAWKDPEKYWHMVRPTTVIEGHRLLIHGIESGQITEKTKIREYHAKDSPANTVKVELPSRSENKTYEVTLEHVPDFQGEDRFVEWTRLRTRHECDIKINDFTLRFNARTVTYCPHDVAAYVAHSRNIAETKRRIISQPFPLFTEPELRLYFTLTHHTMIQERILDNGVIRERKRPLTFPEIDTFLMDSWLLHGNDKTFYVESPTKAFQRGSTTRGKRMRDYDWNPQSAGMKF